MMFFSTYEKTNTGSQLPFIFIFLICLKLDRKREKKWRKQKKHQKKIRRKKTSRKDFLKLVIFIPLFAHPIKINNLKFPPFYYSETPFLVIGKGKKKELS